MILYEAEGIGISEAIQIFVNFLKYNLDNSIESINLSSTSLFGKIINSTFGVHTKALNYLLNLQKYQVYFIDIINLIKKWIQRFLNFIIGISFEEGTFLDNIQIQLSKHLVIVFGIAVENMAAGPLKTLFNNITIIFETFFKKLLDYCDFLSKPVCDRITSILKNIKEALNNKEKQLANIIKIFMFFINILSTSIEKQLSCLVANILYYIYTWIEDNYKISSMFPINCKIYCKVKSLIDNRECICLEPKLSERYAS